MAKGCVFDMKSEAYIGMKDSQACPALEGVGNRYLIGPFFRALRYEHLALGGIKDQRYIGYRIWVIDDPMIVLK